ncbi:hypothetical protein EVAR_16754_1 [Eumeta japonica]|uniref:Uncharacterized protein n=1 Tax=Eumeta variegata TaxID=151549 RepID=A0A4C1UKY3_EUMVA|nr:hypothetical protein EVAR_16754_1 [Eumeta japonica]
MKKGEIGLEHRRGIREARATSGLPAELFGALKISNPIGILLKHKVSAGSSILGYGPLRQRLRLGLVSLARADVFTSSICEMWGHFRTPRAQTTGP